MSSMTTDTVTGERATSPSCDDTAQQRWRCMICGFVYDEALGLPDEGITPGTPWSDVPESWTCPDCGVSKTDFSTAPPG